MSNERDIAIDGLGSGDDPSTADRHIVQALAAVRSIAEKVPSWVIGRDLGARSPLVLAVIDFGQIGGDFVRQQPAQLGRALGTPERTAVHVRDRKSTQGLA